MVLGGLKVGHKSLFIRDQEGTYSNVKPLCVLDFYVHESCQRQGIGRRLFEVSLAISTGLTYFFSNRVKLGVWSGTSTLQCPAPVQAGPGKAGVPDEPSSHQS